MPAWSDFSLSQRFLNTSAGVNGKHLALTSSPLTGSKGSSRPPPSPGPYDSQPGHHRLESPRTNLIKPHTFVRVHHPNEAHIFWSTFSGHLKPSSLSPQKGLTPIQRHLLLLPTLRTCPPLPSAVRRLSLVKPLHLQAVSARSLLFLALTVTWFSPEDTVSPAASQLSDPSSPTALVSLDA